MSGGQNYILGVSVGRSGGTSSELDWVSTFWENRGSVMAKWTILCSNRPIQGRYSSHSSVLRSASSHSSVNIFLGQKRVLNHFLVFGPQNYLAAFQRHYYPRSSQAISQKRLAEPTLQHFRLSSRLSWYSTTCLIYPAGGAYLRFRTKRKPQRLPKAAIYSPSEHEVKFEW